MNNANPIAMELERKDVKNVEDQEVAENAKKVIILWNTLDQKEL